MEKLNEALLEGSLTAQTREAIVKSETAGPPSVPPTPDQPAAGSGPGQRERVMLAAMVLAAPEFQRR